MKILFEDIMQYHCPRWNELPEIELYIDQVIYILESNLSIFNKHSDTPLITSSMINNYVKQHILKPPTKKKYNREHTRKCLIQWRYLRRRHPLNSKLTRRIFDR